MKKTQYGVLSILLIFVFIGCACGNNDHQTNLESSETSPQEISSEMFSKRDLDSSYDETAAVHITLNGTSAHCDSESVKIDGTTITITDEGTYLISGTLNDGMIIVDAESTDKPQIVLDNASIYSETSAAFYVPESDKVFLTLADGSENSLTNGGTFSESDNNIDGTLFSKQDLTVNGSGSLEVSSPNGHGIVCKDDFVLTGGTLTITSASHGLDVNDSVRITGASLSVAAGKDGIHSEHNEDSTLGFIYIADGTFDISAEGDGLSAGADMQILDGTFQILTGGGCENADRQTSESWGMHGGMGDDPGMHGSPEKGGYGGYPGTKPTSETETTKETEDGSEESTSIKGLKSVADLVVSGGTFSIDSADDAVHSNASIMITGGTFDLSTGDDGIHSDEKLSVIAGDIHIRQCYEGLESLHIDISGGDISAVCTDDGLNAAGGVDASGYGGQRKGDQFGGSGNSEGTIHIGGGHLDLTAYGDGIDANGSIEISGGNILVAGPTMGDTAVLDYDTEAVICGGTFIGTGAYQMAQTFSDSEQGVIAVSVGEQRGGTQILISDSNGNEMFSYTSEIDFAIVIFSSPDMEKGGTYTIKVGSSSGSFQAY